LDSIKPLAAWRNCFSFPIRDRLTGGWAGSFSAKPACRPGVYLMKDAEDKLVYVGKGKDLKPRLQNDPE